MKEHLDRKFIRNNPDEKDFDMYVEIGKKCNHINRLSEKLSKRSLIDKISKRLSELEFKLNHSIKSKALKVCYQKNIAIIIKTRKLIA